MPLTLRRLVLLAVACALLVPAASASADTVAVHGGTLTYAVDPGDVVGVKLGMATMVKTPCRFKLKDRETGKQTDYDGRGPCLLFTAGDAQERPDPDGDRFTANPRPLTAGPGCLRIELDRDDAVCTLNGVSRVVLRGGPHADEIDLDELGMFGHYYAIGTDDPPSLPAKLTVELGGGDDTLDDGKGDIDGSPSPFAGMTLSCGAGADTLRLARGIVLPPDCEGDGEPRPVGTAGGALTDRDGVVRYVAPNGLKGYEASLTVGLAGDRRGQAAYTFSGPTTQTVLGRCLWEADRLGLCPMAGVKRVEVVMPRRTGSFVAVDRRDGEIGDRYSGPVAPIHVDTGAKVDEIDVDNTSAQRVSCGNGIDVVTADRRDVLQGDCERVKGRPKRKAGAKVRLPRRATWYRVDDGRPNRMDLEVGCPARIRDDSCGGKLELFYTGSYLGTIPFAMARGKRRTVTFFFQMGEGARGQSNIAEEYAGMKRDIRGRGGARLRTVVIAGGKRYRGALKVTRFVRRGRRG